MSSNLSRRDFLKGAAAVPLVAALPAIPEAPFYGPGIPSLTSVQAAQAEMNSHMLDALRYVMTRGTVVRREWFDGYRLHQEMIAPEEFWRQS